MSELFLAFVAFENLFKLSWTVGQSDRTLISEPSPPSETFRFLFLEDVVIEVIDFLPTIHPCLRTAG